MLMTMNEDERQRLRQLERATEELADSLDFLQQAMATGRQELERKLDEGFKEINQSLQILIDQSKVQGKAIQDIQDAL